MRGDDRTRRLILCEARPLPLPAISIHLPDSMKLTELAVRVAIVNCKERNLVIALLAACSFMIQVATRQMFLL